jgi:hypothetical protein
MLSSQIGELPAAVSVLLRAYPRAPRFALDLHQPVIV